MPIPSDFTWSTSDQLRAWVTNAESRDDIQLLSEQQEPFIRIRIAPPSAFVLRGPNLPADAGAVTSVRLVYRSAPAEPRHLLNVFYAFVVPGDAVDDTDRALLGFALDAPTWSSPRSSPIAGRLLDIRSIQLTR